MQQRHVESAGLRDELWSWIARCEPAASATATETIQKAESVCANGLRRMKGSPEVQSTQGRHGRGRFGEERPVCNQCQIDAEWAPSAGVFTWARGAGSRTRGAAHVGSPPAAGFGVFAVLLPRDHTFPQSMTEPNQERGLLSLWVLHGLGCSEQKGHLGEPLP